jgi:lantibiotic modifying enzyme
LCIATLLRATDLHLGNVIAAGAHPVLVDAETLWQVPALAAAQTLDPTRTCLIPARDEGGAAIPSAFGPAATGFVDQIVEGFCMTVSQLLKNRRVRNHVYSQLKRAAAQPWRRIAWNTSKYESLRRAAITPELLTDGAARFEWLRVQCNRAGTTPAFVFQEAAALARFDIPYFRLKIDDGRQYQRLPDASTVLGLANQIREAFEAKCFSFLSASPA